MEKISIEKLEELQNDTTTFVCGAGFADIDDKNNAIWLEYGTFYNKDWQKNCYYVKQKKFFNLNGLEQGGVGVTLLTIEEFLKITNATNLKTILKGVKNNVKWRI